jgi:hypothetical protein
VSVAEGTASQAIYGIRSVAITNVPLNNAAAGSALAADIVNSLQNPVARFTGATINMNALGSAQQDLVAGIEIGDSITVTKNFAIGSPSTVTQNVFVESVRHSISANRHTVELALIPATVYSPFFFDVDSFDSGASFASY